MATHIIIGGVVANTINATVAEAQAVYPDAVCIPADTGAIGWLWDGESLTPPTVQTPVPQAITMRQARLALLGVGLLDDVDQAIAAIPDPATRKAAQIEWEFSNELQRGNPFVQLLAPALGLSSEQVDQLFVQGATL